MLSFTHIALGGRIHSYHSSDERNIARLPGIVPLYLSEGSTAVAGQISELQDRSKDIDGRLKSRRVSNFNDLLGPFYSPPDRKSRDLFQTFYPTSPSLPHLLP